MPRLLLSLMALAPASALACDAAAYLTCDATATGRNDGVGSTNSTDAYACTTWDYSGPEITYTFSTPVTQSVTVSLTGLSADLDLHVLPDAAACGTAGCVATSENTGTASEAVTFTAVAGQVYAIAVDGYLGATSSFSLHMGCVDSAPVLSQSTLAPGDMAWAQVDWATPGETIHFLRSSDAGVSCPPALGGLCVDLADPLTLIGTAVADASGTATLNLSVPASIPVGLDVYTQAVAVRGAGGSASVKTNSVAAELVGTCLNEPARASGDAPTSGCNYMDWGLSPDGWYVVSQFGTDGDPTTWGRTTTCGFLQGHYDAWGCRYDHNGGGCLGGSTAIPHVQGHVDYLNADVIATVNAYAPGSVPDPDIFYVAGAQRFGCGATLRVSNPSNGRCVVVYAEDGGPGVTYEGPGYGQRRILDASPAVNAFLQTSGIGWLSGDMVQVEWGQPGDVPGQACTPCGSTLVQQGTEGMRTPWDPNHMQSALDCR